MITKITTDELRKMRDCEGLIVQGCGGGLNEWVNGVNSMLTEADILIGESRFTDVSQFEHDGVTCLLFKFTDDVPLDTSKLAIWRLQTHEAFGGTWLSDYVPNRLGGFAEDSSMSGTKPDCALIGQDGNIFNLLGIAARTLHRCRMADEAKEMTARAVQSGSYDEALCIIGEYVNIVGSSEGEDVDKGFDPMTM